MTQKIQEATWVGG